MTAGSRFIYVQKHSQGILHWPFMVEWGCLRAGYEANPPAQVPGGLRFIKGKLLRDTRKLLSTDPMHSFRNKQLVISTAVVKHGGQSISSWYC